jgi:hypothetical protein
MDYNQLRSILELLYFASGPIVAAAAIVGLLQLVIAKRAAETANRRAAYELAIAEIKQFTTNIVPLSDAFRRKLEKSDDYTVEKEVTIQGDSIVVSDPRGCKELHLILASTEGDLENLVNLLESFALAFTSGVASERIAFNSVGHLYCQIVSGLSPYLVRVTPHRHKEDAILGLYIVWRQRIERHRALSQQEELQERLRNNPDGTIEPVDARTDD